MCVHNCCINPELPSHFLFFLILLFFKIFIYIFLFWLCRLFIAVQGLSLVVVSRGYFLVAVLWASHWVGFSCCGAQALRAWFIMVLP